MPLDDLYRLPGDDPAPRHDLLGHGELITAVEVPPLAFGRWSTYRKVRDRASYAFAVASVAAALDVDDGVVRDVRLAFGAVAPRPWRARVAERRPAGAAGHRGGVPPRPRTPSWPPPARCADNGFKVPLVRNVVVRTLADLADAADVAGLVDLP